ncbi:MAG: metal ABC transporter substrate-binding protein [Chloroflexota bacterium]|nr:metal ABC transporter substrate-binding protein [Chloroflexota bacterium]
MLTIASRKICFGRLALPLAIGLLVFAALLMGACTDNQEEQPAGASQPAAAVSDASSGSQPSQPAQSSQPSQQAQQAQQPQVSAVDSSMAGSAPASPAVTNAGGEAATPSGPPIQVVTTTNFAGDWARVVGGDRADVFALLPPGGDPHSFVPGGSDVARVADADVVFTVGLGLEADWLHDLVHNAQADESRVIELGEVVDPLEFSGADPHGHGEEGHDEHGHMEAGHEEIGHDDHGHEEMTELQGKLLVGDGETGALSVIELDHGEVEQNAFDMGSRAGRIYATKSGRFAIAVSSDANMVHVIDGGTYLEPHGDHFDLVNREAAPIGLDLSGDRPVHLFVGDEWASVYYDGSGDVLLINEHELEEEGASYQPVWQYAGPQHGAAVPLAHDLFAITPQHPDYASNPEQYRLPTTVDIRDLSGNILYSAGDCPDLHGDAGNGHVAVFGCTGGVLTVEADHGQYHHSFISAPAGEPEDFRLTTVWGASRVDHFLALGSAVGLYLVEPEEGEMEQMVAAEEGNSPIQATMSRDGELAVVVMSSGEIRLYDLHDGDVIATNSDALTTPVETGFWARPHIAMAPGAIFVTDSVGGQVLQLDDHDLEEVGHWDVAGNPTKIAFVGIYGEPEGHEEMGHGHEEMGGHEEVGHDEHGHEGHDHGPLDPHFWFDPIRVKLAVNEIAYQLAIQDPDNASVYDANATNYGEQLDELHAWIQEHVAMVPPERRLLITSHDTFAYLAEAYGFKVVGLVIPSLAPDVEPSAEHLAELIEVVRENDVPAVFGETTVSDRLANAIARETGAELVQLYTGSMGGPGSGADTYLSMVRTNVERIVEALK